MEALGPVLTNLQQLLTGSIHCDPAGELTSSGHRGDKNEVGLGTKSESLVLILASFRGELKLNIGQNDAASQGSVSKTLRVVPIRKESARVFLTRRV